MYQMRLNNLQYNTVPSKLETVAYSPHAQLQPFVLVQYRLVLLVEAVGCSMYNCQGGRPLLSNV